MSDNVDEVTISFGDLNEGEMYPIRTVVIENREFGTTVVPSVKVDISESDLLTTTTYLPSSLISYGIENVALINQAYNDGKPFCVCLYGALIMGKNKKDNSDIIKFIGKIHNFGEVADPALLRQVQGMKTKLRTAVQKKTASDENEAGPSPEKQAKASSSVVSGKPSSSDVNQVKASTFSENSPKAD